MPVVKTFRSSIAAAWRAMARPENLAPRQGEKALHHMTQVERELRVGVHVKYAGFYAGAVQGNLEFSATGVNRLIDPPNVPEHARMHVNKKRMAKKP
ncbi:MAG TPA: hypothetical protein VNX46_12335 [Candidatus Acidoferrum sp.]|jgi:hypothetical protein|nr:hypothetical protein [Candidatus Acidoferrum sp.]